VKKEKGSTIEIKNHKLSLKDTLKLKEQVYKKTPNSSDGKACLIIKHFD
jgi:hypothetical protein